MTGIETVTEIEAVTGGEGTEVQAGGIMRILAANQEKEGRRTEIEDELLEAPILDGHRQRMRSLVVAGLSSVAIGEKCSGERGN